MAYNVELSSNFTRPAGQIILTGDGDDDDITLDAHIELPEDDITLDAPLDEVITTEQERARFAVEESFLVKHPPC